MLEKFFKDPEAVKRHRANSFGSILDHFADYISKETPSLTTRRAYIYVAAHFNYWLKAKHIPLSTVNETTIDKFLSKHPKKCSCSVVNGARYMYRPRVLQRYLNLLREHHLIPQKVIATSISPIDKILQDFRKYMEEIRGLTPSTIRLRSFYTREFLKTKYRNSSIDLKELTVKEIRKYIIAKATVYKIITPLITSLRSFFRFLKVIKQIEQPLENAVPKIFTPRKLSTIPKYLTEDQLQQFLSSLNLTTPVGLRIRAAVLLMSRLSLRINEVTQLKLEDINWREGIIEIKKNKSRRVSTLPLPQEVGKALVDYLKKGRPRTNERYIFVTHLFPSGKPLSNSCLHSVIRRAFNLCKLSIPFYGTNVFRRTLATELLQKNAKMIEISDLFRHRDIDTTKLYAKVNLKQLAEVALPWPEVKS